MKIHKSDDLVQKVLKSNIVRAAVAFELIAGVGSYVFWRKLNTDIG